MAILDTINNKINEYRINSPEVLEKINKILDIINSTLDALKNNESIVDYDFSIAINLVDHNVNSFGIIDLKKGIDDIKNTLEIKRKFNLDYLTLSEDQNRVIEFFIGRLEILKKDLNVQINEQSKKRISDEIFENLDDLRKLLEGNGRRKYYTYDMLESLFQIIDYDSLTYSDMQELVNALSIAKNNNEQEIEATA